MKKTDNKGFSLVELIVVIAIMAVLLVLAGLSIAFLFGTDARSAAQKISAQLSETKTGSMSRYDESMTLSYKTKDVDNGIPSDGYYVEHNTWTIANTEALIKANTESETRKVASSRVIITLYYGGGASLELEDTHSITISYDRTSGAMDAAIIDNDTTNPVMLERIVLKSGRKEYTITFVPETGKHVVE